MAETMTEIVLRMNLEDQQRILNKLRNGMGIKETIQLNIYDSQARFSLGYFPG